MKTLLFLLLGVNLLGGPLWIERGTPLPAELIRYPVRDTGSMRPAINRDTFIWCRPYAGQVSVGDWVVFLRGDGTCVMHAVTAVNKRAVLTSGLANRWSEWILRGQILGVVRYVERVSSTPSASTLSGH